MARLSLALLGGLQVTLDGAPVTAIESDKGRALLAYLAVEADRLHRREVLTGLLWPDVPEASARRSLSQALFNLRQAIGDHQAEPPFLLITRDSLQFNLDSTHSLDVASFNALLAACDAHPHARIESCAVCAPRLQQAIEQYRGDFLVQFFLEDSAAFEEWALLQRENLHRRALNALAHLADYHEQRQDYAPAIHACSRQLALDPWREEAHQQMMRTLALNGQRSAALAQYEICRRVLANELGVEPSAETKALYEQIKAGEQPLREASLRSRGAGEKTPLLPRSPAPLPAPLTPFVGRERELAEISRLLADPTCRLLTLVGPGGVGKTRLALEAALPQREVFADGVNFVALVGINSAEFIAPTIADALGFTFYGPADPKAQLLNYLREKQVLLVLDNFEHLLAVGPLLGVGVEWLGEILVQAPGVKLLVTSREQLHLQAEWTFEVQGLPIPKSAQIGELEASSAIMLFLQRARQARVGFTLTADDHPAVLRICRLVEGLPLGIELAAAWVRTLSCREIAQEIERGLDFLAAARRDVPERHHSIKAVFDHSWKLLSMEEQGVLRQLSVFRGGFRREATQQVAGATLPLLSALVSKSLVRSSDAHAGRYDLHQLIRQYAATRLQEEAQEERAAHDRHAAYYLTLLQTHEPALFSHRQKEALAELDAEIDNIRTAWEVAVAHQQLDLIRRMTLPLWFFYDLRNYLREGEALFERGADMVRIRLAELEEGNTTLERARLTGVLGDLLTHQACLTHRQGRNAEAIRLYQSSLALLRPLDEPAALAHALAYYAALCWLIGEWEEAWRCLHESLPLFRTLELEWEQARCLALIGFITHEQGAYTEAYRLLSDAMTRCRALGEPHLLTFTINFLSRTAQALGRLVEVQDLLREGLRLATETGDRFGMGLMLERMAVVTQASGDKAEAHRLFEKSVNWYREVGEPWSMARTLNLLGYLFLAMDDAARAWESFNQALKTAVAAQIIPGALDALVGLAMLSAQKGDNEAALELIVYLLMHPSTTQEAKDQAERLLAGVETHLSPPQVEAIRAQAQTKSFEAVVTELLRS